MTEDSAFRESLTKALIHTYIHTYDTYVRSSSSSSSSRRHVTTSIHPKIWHDFRKAVRFNEAYDVHANHVLEAFMRWYTDLYTLDRRQVKLTQVFIEKPEQVNIAEKIEIHKREPLPDLASLSLEELQSEYESAKAHHHMGRMSVLMFELKNRQKGV